MNALNSTVPQRAPTAHKLKASSCIPLPLRKLIQIPSSYSPTLAYSKNKTKIAPRGAPFFSLLCYFFATFHILCDVFFVLPRTHFVWTIKQPNYPALSENPALHLCVIDLRVELDLLDSAPKRIRTTSPTLICLTERGERRAAV